MYSSEKSVIDFVRFDRAKSEVRLNIGKGRKHCCYQSTVRQFSFVKSIASIYFFIKICPYGMERKIKITSFDRPNNQKLRIFFLWNDNRN